MSTKRAGNVETPQTFMSSWLSNAPRPEKRQRKEEISSELLDDQASANKDLHSESTQERLHFSEKPQMSYAQAASQKGKEKRVPSEPSAFKSSSAALSGPHSTKRELNKHHSKSESEKNSEGSRPSVKPITSTSNAKNSSIDPTETPKKTLTVTQITGDIFDAPPNAVIIHACNCLGSWGAGIAAAFKAHYPPAYVEHNSHCSSHKPTELFGTAQLIPPSPKTKRQHYVGCLFTSKRFGRFKDSPRDILAATRPAMIDLLTQIKDIKEQGGTISEVRICQINAGLFNVPWEKTKEVLEEIAVQEGMPDTIFVFVRP